MDVTARELKNRLGTYLAAVRRGETVRVTHRGTVVAEMKAPAQKSMSKLDRLVAEGRATPGRGKLRPFTPWPAIRSGTEIILADREDERP
jgi:prevent-host-death family protein